MQLHFWYEILYTAINNNYDVPLPSYPDSSAPGELSKSNLSDHDESSASGKKHKRNTMHSENYNIA